MQTKVYAEPDKLPSKLQSGEAFTNVVGGHGRKADGKVNDGKSFLLVDGWLLKPFQAQAKVDSAIRFYEAVTQLSGTNLSA